MSTWAHAYGTCVQMPAEQEEGIEFPGSGVTGGCEPPSMGTGNQTQILQKTSKHSAVEPSLKGSSIYSF